MSTSGKAGKHIAELFSGWITFHFISSVDGEIKKTGTRNAVAAAITSTCVAHTPGFQFCWHKSSIVLMFNDGIKYGLRVVLLFGVLRFSQQCFHLVFQIIETIMLSKSSYHLV